MNEVFFWGGGGVERGGRWGEREERGRGVNKSEEREVGGEGWRGWRGRREEVKRRGVERGRKRGRR